MREIELTKGYKTVVDDADYERAMTKKWWASVTPQGNVYARRREQENNVTRYIYLHNFLMFPPDGRVPDGYVVDHKNRNGLDNRRENLRQASRGENQVNSLPWGKRQLRGVGTPTGRSKTFTARITHNGKSEHLGRFRTPEEAARAYDYRALEIFGEFAYLNFPEPAQQRIYTEQAGTL